jgi:hypothetical protein
MNDVVFAGLILLVFGVIFGGIALDAARNFFGDEGWAGRVLKGVGRLLIGIGWLVIILLAVAAFIAVTFLAILNPISLAPSTIIIWLLVVLILKQSNRRTT